MHDWVTHDELDAAIKAVRLDIDLTEQRLEGRLSKRLDRQDIALLAILAGVFATLAAAIGALIYVALSH